MTLIVEKQAGGPNLPSGKEVAIKQRQIADLEAKEERLRKQCNFFDSLLKEKSRALADLDEADADELIKRSEEYATLVDQSDRLFILLANRKESLEKINTEISNKRKELDRESHDSARQVEKLKKRVADERAALNEVATEHEKKSRDLSRIESRLDTADKALTQKEQERRQHDIEMEGEQKAIRIEKENLARQVRDLAVKHGRLQRVAADLGVKGV